MKRIWKDNQGNLRVIWGVLFSCIVTYIPVLLILGIGQILFKGNETYMQLLMGLLGPIITITMTTFFLKKNFNKEVFDFFDYTKGKLIKKISIGLLFGIAWIGLETLILIALGQKQIVYRGIPIIKLLAGISTFLGMAVIEECAFRAVIIASLKKYKTPVVLIVSAILFTVMHQDLWMEFSVMRAIELLLSGILFGLVLLTTKSITFVTAMHFAYNVFGAVILGVDSTNGLFETTVTGGYNMLTGINGGASIIGIIISIVLIIGFGIYGIKNKNL